MHGGSPQTSAEAAAERTLVSNLLKGCALFPVLPERAAERDHLFRTGGAAAFKAIADVDGGGDDVSSLTSRAASPSANTKFHLYCSTRPLPETFLKQPGTLDLARRQELFPISVNTRLIADTTTSSQGVYISALPDAAVPWMSILAKSRCTGNSERQEELDYVHQRSPKYIEGLVAHHTRVKLCGQVYNGKCGTIVGQRNPCYGLVHRTCACSRTLMERFTLDRDDATHQCPREREIVSTILV